MHVQRLRIRNFRSLSDVLLDNLPPLVILFGLNGSGKSNVLAALEAIFSAKVEPGATAAAPQISAPFYRGLITDFHHNFYRNSPSQARFEVLLRTTRSALKRQWPKGFRDKVTVATAAPRQRLALAGRFEPIEGFPMGAEIVLESAKLNSVLLYDHRAVEEPWLPDHKEILSLDERSDIGESLLATLTGMYSTIGAARFLRREPFSYAPHGAQEAQKETMVSDQERELARQDVDEGADLPSLFKRRLFTLKHSQQQADQDKYRRIVHIFREVARWGQIDFSQSGPYGEDLEVMTWDESDLWLPVTRRGAGAEQLLVMISEVIVRGVALVGIEELESNLDDAKKEELFNFLAALVGTEDSGLGQVIGTAHSSFYAKKLQNHQKRFVRMDDEGRSIVEPWSEDTYAKVFPTRVGCVSE